VTSSNTSSPTTPIRRRNRSAARAPHLQNIESGDFNQSIPVIRINSNMSKMVGKARLPFRNRNTQLNRQNSHRIGADDQDEPGLLHFRATRRIQIYQPNLSPTRVTHRSINLLLPIPANRLNPCNKNGPAWLGLSISPVVRAGKAEEIPATWTLFSHSFRGGSLRQTLNWHSYDKYVTRTGTEQMEFKEPPADPNGYKRRTPAVEL
jgi:hypothetical protein